MLHKLTHLVCAALATIASTAALAQTPPAPKPAEAAKPADTPNTAGAPAQTQQPQLDGVALAILIKSAVIALHQANVTGNYSVLRDLGTPVFRERFDVAGLTAIFSNLRSRGVNLTPVLMLTPTLAQQPEITPQGELKLAGAFPTEPLQIQFNLLYQRIDNTWRIAGLAVDAVDPKAAPGPQATAAPAPPAPAAPAKDAPKDAAPKDAGKKPDAAKPDKKPK